MTSQALSVGEYESQVEPFKPVRGLAATNPNDLRLFLYDWFTHFEHASVVDFYLSHLDDNSMSIAFPGMAPLTSHAAFIGWYSNLLAQTLWNFHDISAMEVKQTSPQDYLISFVVDWYGEVRPGSDQLAGWQSRSDSHIYHHRLRQTWTVKVADRLLIEKIIVTGADTPSPISTGQNKSIVQGAFDAWRAGTGSPFDLLDEHATWTIVGHSLASKTYRSRAAFLDEVIKPFNARLSRGLKPVIRNIYADADTVIVFFDAEGMARDGKPYQNTYVWLLDMREGTIVRAFAFFDSLVFNDFWGRVSPVAH